MLLEQQVGGSTPPPPTIPHCAGSGTLHGAEQRTGCFSGVRGVVGGYSSRNESLEGWSPTTQRGGYSSGGRAARDEARHDSRVTFVSLAGYSAAWQRAWLGATRS